MSQDESFEFIKALFSFNSDYWVNVEIDGIMRRFKYRPLTIHEKIDIHHKYEDLDEKLQAEATAKEQCLLMLRKASPNLNIDNIPMMKVLMIYEAIIRDSESRKSTLNKLYETHKTLPLKTNSERTPSKLDSLVNLGMITKELNMSLKDVSDLDDLSLVTLLIFINEIAVRESNSYEKANNKRK